MFWFKKSTLKRDIKALIKIIDTLEKLSINDKFTRANALAEGKNILLLPKVVSRVLPEETSTSLSPLINRLTGPEGNNFALAPRSIPTKTKVITKNTKILAIITE